MNSSSTPPTDPMATAAFAAHHATAIQTQFEFEKVRMVWMRPASTLLMAPLVGAMTAYVLWNRCTVHAALLGWLFALCAIYVMRGAYAHRFRRRPPASGEANARWNRLLLITTAAAGAMWGAVTLLPLSGDGASNVAFIGFVLGGVTAASVVTIAAHRDAAFAFVVPCLGTFTLYVFAVAHVYGIGIITLMYFVVAANAIDYYTKALADNVRLRLLAETERARAAASEQSVEAQRLRNELIGRAQDRFIRNADFHQVMSELLADILVYTQSEYGFIGEVLRDNDSPYLKTHAITDIAWDNATRELYARQSQQGLEFRNLDTLFGAALVQRTAVIANDPQRDPRAGGLPPGHPPLRSFLGAPIKLGNDMLGLIGLANRDGGYDESVLNKLAPILTLIAQFIDAKRNERARIAAEQHVARMHAQLSAFIEHTPAAVAMLDRDLVLLAHSQRWRHDFNITEESLLGKQLYDVLPDIPALWRESYQRALAGGVEGDDADPYIRSDGTVRWFRWEARPWFESEAAIGGMVLFCEDVTESKRAADALHARDQLLSKLSARIPGVLFQLRYQPATRTSSLLYVSEGSQALYDKSPEELADDPDYMFRICHEDDRLLMNTAIDNTVRAGGLLDLEHRIVVPGREPQWVRIEAVLERLADASVVWHGYINDITERKHSEAAMAELSKRLRLAARAHGLGVWDCDLATNRLTFDDRLCEIYSVAPQEVANPWDLWRERLHPEDRQRALAESGEFANLADRGMDLFLTEFRICLPDGSVRRLRSRGTVERDNDGRALRLVGINWDMGLESELTNAPLRTFTVLRYTRDALAPAQSAPW